MKEIIGVAVMLTKTDGHTSTTTQTISWRESSNENEVIGIAVQEAMKLKPGFHISVITPFHISLEKYVQPKVIETKDSGMADQVSGGMLDRRSPKSTPDDLTN